MSKKPKKDLIVRLTEAVEKKETLQVGDKQVTPLKMAVYLELLTTMRDTAPKAYEEALELPICQLFSILDSMVRADIAIGRALRALHN